MTPFSNTTIVKLGSVTGSQSYDGVPKTTTITIPSAYQGKVTASNVFIKVISMGIAGSKTSSGKVTVTPVAQITNVTSTQVTVRTSTYTDNVDIYGTFDIYAIVS